MHRNSTISRTVMRRVHTIHAVRPFFSVSALASLVLVVALWGIGREVWVAHVVENFIAVVRGGHVLAFIASAFVHTGLIVQALSVLILAAAAWLVRDGVRTLSYSARTA